MTRRALLFDLDGTLLESRPGIVAALRHAMDVLGCPLDPAEDLSWAVGPPLADVAARLLAPFGDDRHAALMTAYRARYDAHGLFDCAVYAGIPAVLDEFRAGGWRLFVATSKGGAVARRLLEHFRLAPWFEAIYGSDDDGALAHKPELIAHILAREALAPEATLMLGDRRFDISGAHANDLRAVGVLWGYGGREELEQAGADALAEHPAALPVAAASLLRER
ncbi:MAG: HAD hydrolase-like protein [Alphaproteobacteria bacterium]|nr:HAD hydrolase-like protein [Alphaproteobacteria bacterium]